jgi:hypothetical protein
MNYMRFDIASLSAVSHQQKLGRAQEKRTAILRFLADGELYVTVDVAMSLLNVSRPVAAATLKALEVQKGLKSESLLIPDDSGQPRLTKIFGITQTGRAVINADPNAPVFELGRANPFWVPHHRRCQLSRIAAEQAGWTGWTSERILRAGGAKLKKIPDAIATSPDGLKVAIEVERHVKTIKRYEEIQWLYVADLKNGKVDRVVYLCPPEIARSIQKIFRHLAKRVDVFDYTGWPHTPLPPLSSKNIDIEEEECEHPVISSE